MPELPEVETVRRGIEPQVVGRTIVRAVVREPRLRWPVPPQFARQVRGVRVHAAERRGKYLLLRTPRGTLLLHLGMSGRLYLLEAGVPAGRHDHIDLEFDHGLMLRLQDPRRFGAVLWCTSDPARHPLLRNLGPEPLGAEFSGDYLFARSRGRRLPVKSFLMDGRVVVGVGNIYAAEALFRAGLRPGRSAGRISRAAYMRLAASVREVLNAAIAAGGTSFRDYRTSAGVPGYFQQELHVYGRTDAPCRVCGTPIRAALIAQRSSFYCPSCQR